LQTTTYEKLDRILATTEWELKFPKVTVQTLARGVSDHMPLLLDTGAPSQQNAYMFKFELAWLFKDGFYEKSKRNVTERNKRIEFARDLAKQN
jgi:hypothetical protein